VCGFSERERDKKLHVPDKKMEKTERAGRFLLSWFERSTTRALKGATTSPRIKVNANETATTTIRVQRPRARFDVK